MLYNGNSPCSDVQTRWWPENEYVGLKVWNLRGKYSADNAKHILQITIHRFITAVQDKSMFQAEHGICSTSQPLWENVAYVIELF